MTRIILGFALAVLFVLPLPATAADQQPGAYAPARRVMVQRRYDVVPIQQQRRRVVVVRRGYTTPHYWRRYAGPYWGPHYQPWPSYGQYPWEYRPYYGWGPPMVGYNRGSTW